MACSTTSLQRFNIGVSVKAIDLVSKAGRRLNGETGTVSGICEESGRVEVQFADGTRQNLKPDNLKILALDLKECVEVFGLTSEAGRHLNGMIGHAGKYIASKSRLEVQLMNGKVVNLKPENLRKLMTSEGISNTEKTEEVAAEVARFASVFKRRPTVQSAESKSFPLVKPRNVEAVQTSGPVATVVQKSTPKCASVESCATPAELNSMLLVSETGANKEVLPTESSVKKQNEVPGGLHSDKAVSTDSDHVKSVATETVGGRKSNVDKSNAKRGRPRKANQEENGVEATGPEKIACKRVDLSKAKNSSNAKTSMSKNVVTLGEPGNAPQFAMAPNEEKLKSSGQKRKRESSNGPDVQSGTEKAHVPDVPITGPPATTSAIEANQNDAATASTPRAKRGPRSNAKDAPQSAAPKSKAGKRSDTADENNIFPAEKEEANTPNATAKSAERAETDVNNAPAPKKQVRRGKVEAKEDGATTNEINSNASTAVCSIEAEKVNESTATKPKARRGQPQGTKNASQSAAPKSKAGKRSDTADESSIFPAEMEETDTPNAIAKSAERAEANADSAPAPKKQVRRGKEEAKEDGATTNETNSNASTAVCVIEAEKVNESASKPKARRGQPQGTKDASQSAAPKSKASKRSGTADESNSLPVEVGKVDTPNATAKSAERAEANADSAPAPKKQARRGKVDAKEGGATTNETNSNASTGVSAMEVEKGNESTASKPRARRAQCLDSKDASQSLAPKVKRSKGSDPVEEEKTDTSERAVAKASTHVNVERLAPAAKKQARLSKLEAKEDGANTNSPKCSRNQGETPSTPVGGTMLAQKGACSSVKGRRSSKELKEDKVSREFAKACDVVPPQPAKIVDSLPTEVLKKAETLGLRSGLENLASREVIIEKGFPADALLDALHTAGGLVNKAKEFLLAL